MKTTSALVSGLAGATVVTATHEIVRRINPKAPRMDLLGMQALNKALQSLDWKTPKHLFYWTMAGDILANSLYYSLAGVGKQKSVWLRGSALGLAAGIGALILPKPMGLNERYSNRTLETKAMTLGLYVTGALVTTALLVLWNRKKKTTEQEWERKLLTSAMG